MAGVREQHDQPLAALVPTAAVTLAFATSGGAQSPDETVLRYGVRDIGGTFVDSRPKGDSRGDFVTFEARGGHGSAAAVDDRRGRRNRPLRGRPRHRTRWHDERDVPPAALTPGPQSAAVAVSSRYAARASVGESAAQGAA